MTILNAELERGTPAAARWKRVALAASVSLVILALLAWKVEARLQAAAAQLARLDWGLFAAILVFSALWHLFVGADKWWRILRASGADVGYWEVFRVRLGSDPVRFAAPLKTGELVNALYFAGNPTLGFGRAAGSILFDKALNFFGTIFWLYVGLAAMASLPRTGLLGLHTAMATSVVVLACVARLRHLLVDIAARVHRKLGSLARDVLCAFEEFTLRQKLGFLLYGIVFQLRPLAVCGLLFVALQAERLPTLLELLGLGSVVVLMSNIPSLGGIGPREAALVAVFSGYTDPATLLSIGLLMSFAVQVFPALLGIPMMFPLLGQLAEQRRVSMSREVQARLATVGEEQRRETNETVAEMPVR